MSKHNSNTPKNIEQTPVEVTPQPVANVEANPVPATTQEAVTPMVGVTLAYVQPEHDGLEFQTHGLFNGLPSRETLRAFCGKSSIPTGFHMDDSNGHTTFVTLKSVSLVDVETEKGEGEKESKKRGAFLWEYSTPLSDVLNSFTSYGTQGGETFAPLAFASAVAHIFSIWYPQAQSEKQNQPKKAELQEALNKAKERASRLAEILALISADPSQAVAYLPEMQALASAQ